MANHDSVASPFDQLEFQTRISRCASMAISTQEGGTRKRRNLSLRCNSEANSSGTESQGPPFTAHFGYAGLASPVTDVASDRGSARRAEKAKTEKEAEDGL